MICQQTLKAIDQRETMSTQDRFTTDEKKQLLEAYNHCGFQVFQDMQLLQRYIPSRTENDLKGLVSRLKSGMDSNESQDDDPLEDWQRLCLNLMGSYSRNKQANMDDVLADALQQAAQELESQNADECDDVRDNQPNYPKLLRSFSQLLAGRFPDNMTPVNARISMRLFDYVNMIAKSIDIDQLKTEMDDGSWLSEATERRRMQQEMALRGLEEIDNTTKIGPTLRDLERSKNVEALCVELPKIKRITELLNPLQINESLASDLMDAI